MTAQRPHRKVYIPFKDGSAVSYDGSAFVVHRQPVEIDADLSALSEGEAALAWRDHRRDVVKALEEVWWEQEGQRKRDGAKRIYSGPRPLQQARLCVTGVVQGVGFRPFCARTAADLNLTGTVRNTSGGVEVLLEGSPANIDAFVAALWENAPEAAAVSAVTEERALLKAPTFSCFSIEKSTISGKQHVLIPADLAVCERCLEEMREPGNRRFRYPFINCTLCGPRYTLIRSLPYDRPGTTMDSFTMCAACAREYGDPADRRYHAQPNACPVCGPQIWLTDADGHRIAERTAALTAALDAITEGAIVAIKGIGGFHIACLPQDGPVSALRQRKKRPDKPFALMVRDLEAARGLAEVSEGAERLLKGAQRPVVLCPRHLRADIAPQVAPGQNRLGLMLPYAPLHHLLMERFEALVMTSANVSDAPIVSSESEAFTDLRGIVDFFLCHDREIYTPVDDSVLIPDGAEKGAPIFLRRARGYVPVPIALPFEAPDILAAGGQLKSTYALTRGSALFPGQYLGDLDQLGTVRYYKRSLEHFMALYGIVPQILAFDRHPRYTATELAKAFCNDDVRPFPVQHHHAHLASVLLDNASNQPAIGVIFDGTGYGDDGTIWGGEFLVGDIQRVERKAALLPFQLPGGERAIQEPWRCGVALLEAVFGAEEAEERAARLWPNEAERLASILAVSKTGPLTTSCGRLFDGVAAILGLCARASYDAQAASALESCATGVSAGAGLAFDTTQDGALYLLDWRGAVRALLLSLEREKGAGSWAAAFHLGLARAVGEVCCRLREATGIEQAALSGGVWQNALLLRLTCEELKGRGFSVLTHRNVPPNDEGVSVGQAAVAAYNWNEERGDRPCLKK